MDALVCEKVDQAVALLDEFEVDAWLTFVRETSATGESVIPMILGRHLTWQSALILTRRGERIAIVGNYDADLVRDSGAWRDVVTYVQDIRDPLRDALSRLNPARIAVNFSRDDFIADGLSHGLWLLLHDYLSGTPFADRLVSAERIVGALRGRKSAAEVQRIRDVVRETEQIFEEAGRFLAPGRTEAEVAAFMQSVARRRGLELAWDATGCPIVNAGPESAIGHAVPSTSIRIEPGHVVHIDFGVRRDLFCSDLQRCWYVPRSGESQPPHRVQQAFDAVVASIDAASLALRPGVEGWQVDAAARNRLLELGYPEYQHGTGHHLGRAVHDGGGTLGPRWERYGRTPYRKVEAGNVFTLELGVYSNGEHGAIGLEEDVLVAADGVEWLSTPQRRLWTIRSKD